MSLVWLCTCLEPHDFHIEHRIVYSHFLRHTSVIMQSEIRTKRSSLQRSLRLQASLCTVHGAMAIAMAIAMPFQSSQSSHIVGNN